MQESASANDHSNSPVESYGALLIRDDPTGRASVVFEKICDFDAEAYHRYANAYWTVYDIISVNMFVFVKQSALEMFRIWEEASTALREGKISHTDPDSFVEWGTRLRCSILAFCSTIHHHQEQNYIQVKKKFGEDSPEHIKMKTLFGELYDDCFGYRYLYKLRNALVHYSMLALSLKGEARAHQGQTLAMFDVSMDRSVLLDMKGHLNAKLKTELRGLPGDPSVYQMAGEATSLLAELNKKIVAILNPEIDELCSVIREYDAIYEGRLGVRAIGHQQSPEMRPPFTTGYRAMSAKVFKAAHLRANLPPTAPATAEGLE
jgi:hypothetical protein